MLGAADLLPEEIIRHVIALVSSDAKRALRSTCTGMRKLVNNMCTALHFQGGAEGAAGMRYIAARCSQWSGVRELQLSSVSFDSDAGPLLELLFSLCL